MTFKRVKTTLNRWSRIFSPCLVRHLVELGERLNLEIWVKIFRYKVFEKGDEEGTIIERDYQMRIWSAVDANDVASTVFTYPEFVDKVCESNYVLIHAHYLSVPYLLSASLLKIPDKFRTPQIIRNCPKSRRFLSPGFHPI